MTTRRGFLGSLLALAAAPTIAGFVPTPVSVAIDPVRYINVLDYGADPLGRNDSTAAFQRAIDAATWSGKTVLVPAGAFAVSQHRLRNTHDIRPASL
jgi:hypothetical protein